MERETRLFRFYEVILMCSGIFMLISVGVVYMIEDFTIWTIAKMFYGVGVLFFSWYA